MKEIEKSILFIRGGESAKRILKKTPFTRYILIDGNSLNPLRYYVNDFWCLSTGNIEDVENVLEFILKKRIKSKACCSFTRSAYYIPNLLVSKINKKMFNVSLFAEDIELLFDKRRWWEELHNSIKTTERKYIRFDEMETEIDSFCFPCVVKQKMGEEAKNVWIFENKEDFLNFSKKVNNRNKRREEDIFFVEELYEGSPIGVTWLNMQNKIYILSMYKKIFSIQNNKFIFKGYTFEGKKLYFNCYDYILEILHIIVSSLRLKTGIFSAEFISDGNKNLLLLDLGLQCDQNIDLIIEKVYNPYVMLIESLQRKENINERLFKLILDEYKNIEGEYGI